MMTAQSFDEFVAAHREHQGIPLFNTIAVSNDGRAWYADTSATPNLSAEAEALYLERLDTDPITGIARENGVVLLDGSDSRFAWEDAPGARDPGLVPFDEMPMVERSDYVFNANDSFWMPHATEMLDGRLLHGCTAPRTRSARCAPARTPRCCRRPGRDAGRRRRHVHRRGAARRGVRQRRPLGAPPARAGRRALQRGDRRRRARADRRRRRRRPARRERRRHRRLCRARRLGRSLRPRQPRRRVVARAARRGAPRRAGRARRAVGRAVRPGAPGRHAGRAWRRPDPTAIPCSPRWPAPCRR